MLSQNPRSNTATPLIFEFFPFSIKSQRQHTTSSTSSFKAYEQKNSAHYTKIVNFVIFQMILNTVLRENGGEESFFGKKGKFFF